MMMGVRVCMWVSDPRCREKGETAPTEELCAEKCVSQMEEEERRFERERGSVL